MLKRNITFEDFEGNSVTETHYFNMMKSELVRLDVSYDGGMEAAIQAIVDAKDNKKVLREFEYLILSSYGIRSEDGKRFLKSEQISEEFKQSLAYDQLFFELISDEKVCIAFIEGIMPKDLVEMAKKNNPQDKPIGPPPVPRPPVK